MDDCTKQALEAFNGIYEEELYDYLLDMVALHPESFLDLIHEHHVSLLKELREEKHNGHSMYPELQL